MKLDYNLAYNLHCQITLECGRTIDLEALQQWMTYGGWLEGVPSRPWNERFIESAVQKATSQCVEGARPHLLPPARRNYRRTRGDMDQTKSLRSEAAELLPAVTCIGVFRGVFPAADRGQDLSLLTVVWYQDEFALPIGPMVFDQLRAIDWDALATDVLL